MTDLYTPDVEVPITELRANLSEWVGRAREGEDVTITDRGTPVARLVGLDETSSTLERLVADGVIARPRAPKPDLDPNAKLPRAKRSASDIVIEQRG